MFQKKKLNIAILAALAATSQQASSEIEEIVVTATKRAVPLQDAPVAIQAIGSRELENQNIQEFSDYVKYLPNVNAGGRGPGQNEIYIRGAAVDAINITVAESQGSAPNVALYLDEQPVTAEVGTSTFISAIWNALRFFRDHKARSMVQAPWQGRFV